MGGQQQQNNNNNNISPSPTQLLLSVQKRMASSSLSIMLLVGFFVLLSLVQHLPSSSEAAAASSTGSHMLMDKVGGLRLKIPSIALNEGIVSVITSPGIQSLLTSQDNEDNVLALEDGIVVCRGATLKGTSSAERSALAITAVVADTVVVDGITVGDVQAAGWKNTRHARTLTALFRARLAFAQDLSNKKQSLILCIIKTDDVTSSLEKTLLQEVKSLFEATAAEAKESTSFGELYDVMVKSVTKKEDAKEVRVISR